MGIFAAGGVLIHPQNAGFGQQRSQLFLHLLGPKTAVNHLAAAFGADGGDRADAVPAVMAEQRLLGFVIDQRHRTVGTFEHMAAGLAHAHRAVAAAVEQKNALLPPVHGFLQRLGHAGADLPGIAGGQLGAHINKIHRGQRAAAVTVLQRDQPQTAADRRLISLGAGGGGGKEQQGVFHGGAFLGHIMGGIARRGFALIGVLLLLIQNNQAEI